MGSKQYYFDPIYLHCAQIIEISQFFKYLSLFRGYLYILYIFKVLCLLYVSGWLVDHVPPLGIFYQVSTYENINSLMENHKFKL